MNYHLLQKAKKEFAGQKYRDEIIKRISVLDQNINASSMDMEIGMKFHDLLMYLAKFYVELKMSEHLNQDKSNEQAMDVVFRIVAELEKSMQSFYQTEEDRVSFYPGTSK